MQPTLVFRVVQPYGRDRGREATLISEHATLAEAFAAIDRIAEKLERKGTRPDYLELIVVDGLGTIQLRPVAH